VSASVGGGKRPEEKGKRLQLKKTFAPKEKPFERCSTGVGKLEERKGQEEGSKNSTCKQNPGAGITSKKVIGLVPKNHVDTGKKKKGTAVNMEREFAEKKKGVNMPPSSMSQDE